MQFTNKLISILFLPLILGGCGFKYEVDKDTEEGHLHREAEGAFGPSPIDGETHA